MRRLYLCVISVMLQSYNNPSQYKTNNDVTYMALWHKETLIDMTVRKKKALQWAVTQWSNVTNLKEIVESHLTLQQVKSGRRRALLRTQQDWQ